MLIKLSLNRIRLREVLVSQRLTVKMKVPLGSLSIQIYSDGINAKGYDYEVNWLSVYAQAPTFTSVGSE